MARIRIPCLVGKTNKGGVTTWYWQPSATLARAGWTSLPLGTDEGAAIAAARTRNEEVTRWKAGGDIAAAIRARPAAGSLDELIDRYEREWVDGVLHGKRIIAESTAKTYRTSLRRLRIWAGRHPIAYITPPRVTALRKVMMAPEDKGGIGHHAAFQTLKTGRQVFAFAEAEGLIPKGSNPFGQFNLAAPDPRDVVWSQPAREAMVFAAYDAGMPSMALAIMLGFATGQREQDYLAMVHRQYVVIPPQKMQPEDHRTLAAMADDGIVRGIRVRQRKTGAWVEVPVTGMVRWAIETNLENARAAGATTLLLDDTRGGTYRGKAGQTRFQRDFAEVREWAVAAALGDGDGELAAELEQIHFADLRRTCVVYLGELGLDAHLIASITGHDIDETQKILKTYMPRTTGRAARAIALASVRQAREEEARNAGAA